MNPVPQKSKLRASFVAPCVGVGGADAYMLGLIRHCYNIHWTGIAVQGNISLRQIEWARNMIGDLVDIHQPMSPNTPYMPGVKLHQDFCETLYCASENADVIISWCVPHLKNYLFCIDKPIVEIAQNCDEYAASVIKSNEDVVSFQVACSDSCHNVFGNLRPTTTIYNAIDPSRVTPRYGSEIIRRGWGLEEYKIALFMGRFVKEKNPMSLVHAFNLLPEDWALVFVGEGQEDEALFSSVRESLPTHRVRFADPQYHVGDILHASNVFVLPTDFEGMPLAMLEAMLAGVPVVVTDILPVQELENKYGKFANVVPVRPTPQILAHAIIDSQDSRHYERTAFARTLVWERFSITQAAAAWEEYLHNAVHQWRSLKRRVPVIQPKPATPLKGPV